MEINMNDQITIYPTDKGWIRIKELLMSKYRLTDKEADRWIRNRQTDDGGYKDQHWCLIDTFHSMFYNGQSYLHTKIKIQV